MKSSGPKLSGPKLSGPNPYQLLQQAEALMERVDNLGRRAKSCSKKTASLLDEAGGKLAEAVDVLKKEVERRRLLREQYERDLKTKTD